MKTNRNEYLGQLVSTLEFVLVISGKYDFDYVIEASSDTQKKAHWEICTYHDDQQQPCFSRVLDRLNQDIRDDQHKTQFPDSHCICLKTSKNGEEHWKYTIGDLIDWVSVKYDLKEYILADWFKDELEKRVIKNFPNDTDLDKNPDYIRISTLPKVLQLMIEVCNKAEYDSTDANYDEYMAKKKLDVLAKKNGIFFGNNARTDKGLANINAKKVIEFIQKDKN
jgi:hypothetical protein